MAGGAVVRSIAFPGGERVSRLGFVARGGRLAALVG